jgi:Ca-activated chloride channel homolog
MQLRLAGANPTLGILLAVATVAAGSEKPARPSRTQDVAVQSAETQSDMRVDVGLALVPVTVMDPGGEPVIGLTRDNFRLYEDGVEQKLVSLSGEDLPVSVCLVFDLSESMKKKMDTASQAMLALLRSFTQAEDEFCLVVFNERAKVVVPLEAGVQAIEHKLARAKPLGRTALLDAVHTARNQLQQAGNSRKVMIVISDGGDNHSRRTRTEVIKEMRESDVQVYALSVHYDNDEYVPGTLAIEELNGPLLLADLAAEAGGRHVDLLKIGDLPAVGAEITRQLHNQYVLGYNPSAHDGRNHRLQVVVVNVPGERKFRVAHRKEVYTPEHQSAAR